MKNSDIELPKLNKTNENIKEQQIDNASLKEVIKKVQVFLAKSTTKQLLEFILELLLLVIFIILIKLPFQLIIDSGPSIFTFINLYTSEKIYSIWSLVLNIIYTIFGIYYFIKLFKKRFSSIDKRIEKNN